MLLSESEWLYVGLEGAKSIKPLIKKPSVVLNFGESLFAVYPAYPKRDQMGQIPEEAYDPTSRWSPPPGVVPRWQLSEGLLAVSSVHNGNRTGKTQFAAPRGGGPGSIDHFQYGLAGNTSGRGYMSLSGNWVWKASR